MNCHGSYIKWLIGDIMKHACFDKRHICVAWNKTVETANNDIMIIHQELNRFDLWQFTSEFEGFNVGNRLGTIRIDDPFNIQMLADMNLFVCRPVTR